MTGTTGGIILIPIVVVFSLALWLGMVYWAAAHPANRSPKGARLPRSGAAYSGPAAVQAPPHAGPAPTGAEEREKIPARAA